MGWMGWDEETTLDSRMTSIVTAYEGRQGMLRAIFGGSDKAKPAVADGLVSAKDPAAVKALFMGLKAREG